MLPLGISITKGSQNRVSLGHNVRTEETKELNNIDSSRSYLNTILLLERTESGNYELVEHKPSEFFEISKTDVNREFKKFFNDYFADSMAEYNAKQKRSDRLITDYYDKIYRDKQKNPFTEIVVQIGNKDNVGINGDTADMCKAILLDYIQEFQMRNPNLIVVCAALHVEESTIHAHIDFMPIARDCKRGLPTQISQTKAFAQQGYEPSNQPDGKGGVKVVSAYKQWRDNEWTALSELCERHQIQAVHLGNTNRRLDTPEYKEACQRTVEYVRSVTVDEVTLTRNIFGKEVEKKKSPEQIKADQMIAAAQAVLNDIDRINEDRDYYKKLLANEAALIEAKAEKLASGKVTARELEAMRKTKKLEQQFDKICNYIEVKTGLSIVQLLSEIKEAPIDKNQIKMKERNDINYELEIKK